MEILRINKLLDKIVSVICSALVPAGLNLWAVLYWYKNYNNHKLDFEMFMALIALASVAGTVLFMILFYVILPRFQIFRAYKKYEGRWLQIIPELISRPYSIIDFNYNRELRKYELTGINFYKDLQEGGINFEAYRFVERTFRDGFYYITNQTSENKNGLGKIGFIKSNYDDLTRAEGYFFDSSTENMSQKYSTILVKCDRAFFEHIGSQHRYLKIKKLPPVEIMNLSKDFARKELDNYFKRRKDYAAIHTPGCEFCSCDKKIMSEGTKDA